jgi:hypothetical protein
MAYIGNEPEIGFNTLSVQKFNGDGACTQFSISQPISDPDYLEVLVNNVQQEPYASYGVSSGVITFTEAPSVGANNIQIGYKSQSIIYYNQVTSSQLVDGSIGGVKLIDGSITGNKLGITSVSGNNIVVGAITGNLIAVGAVTTNHIVAGAITGNLLATNIINSNNIVDLAILGNDLGIQSVSGNNIGIGAVSGNNIGLGAITGNNFAQPITGNMIGSYAISGNQISTGAISANNFAGGGITSNVFSSNLTISTVRVAETVNVVTTGISGNYNIHVANTTAYYFVANTTGSVTFNLVANSAGGVTGSLNGLLSIGQTASLAIALKQGVTRYRANVFIDGVNPLSSVYWMGATQPSQLGTQAQSLDVYNITVIKVADSAYTVMVGNTTFGSANGFGMGPGGAQ